MALMLVFSVVSVASLSFAADFDDINKPSVFLKQPNRSVCTLCANTMMLRRASILKGDKNWNRITINYVKSVAWVDGMGMLWNYTCNGLTVKRGTIDKSRAKSQLISLLKEHPEGIAVYDTDHPHSVLLTDYTDGVFYCAEPVPSYPSGRIPLTSAFVVRYNNIEAYWYVSSPKLHFSGGSSKDNKTLSKEPNVPEAVALAPSPDIFEKYSFGTYVTTAYDGLRLRVKAVDGEKIGLLPLDTEIDIKEIDNGWGKTVYNGLTGWVCMDYTMNTGAGTYIKTVKLAKNKYEYDGETHKPSVSATDSDGYELQKGDDFNAAYSSGRRQIGEYPVAVNFTGDYTGKITLYFKIVPQKVEKLKASAKKGAVKLTFSENEGNVRYEIYKSTAKDGTFKRVCSTDKTSYTVKDLTGGKTYYFKVRAYKKVDDVKYNGAYSDIKSATVK